MLDLKFIKENIDAVKVNIQNRNVKADADKVVELYDARNKALQELEDLRRQRNENANKMKGKLEQSERQVLIEEGKSLKDLNDGPILMAGVSHCFRREAGSAGQYSKGLYRVHQFSKIEMFVYCKPGESDAIHEKLRSIEEEIFSSLDIPFRVVDTCTGDLGGSAYRKYDLEAWMPGRGENGDWGEITSTSNCTDYQSRRLGIRYKDENGNNINVHTLNGTAIAISRAIISIMENFQQEDGSIKMPEKLIPYTGFKEIRR
jgi:seryl-tRNA synthetase